MKLQTLSDLSEGAVGMYNDSNFIYNYKYCENLVFFLIISGLVTLLQKHGKKSFNKSTCSSMGRK